MLHYYDPFPLTFAAIATPIAIGGPTTPITILSPPSIVPQGIDDSTSTVKVTVQVASYTPETNAKLNTLHLVIVSPGFTNPASPADLLAAPHPQGSVDTSTSFGGTYVIDIPNARDVVTNTPADPTQTLAVIVQPIGDLAD